MAVYREKSASDHGHKNKNYFLFDVHHLIFDGTSVTVFLNEISYLYEKETPACEEGMRGNDESQKLFKQEMKSEVCSLLDMASKEEALKTTPQYQVAREYFQKKLADVEAGDSLLKDYRPKTVRAVCDTVRVSLGEPLSIMAAEQFVRQNGISENTLFLGRLPMRWASIPERTRACSAR